jgi:hypothetical protein
MQHQVAWLNQSPYCWVASTDGGKTWTKLKADNDEESFAAIDEAVARFGVSEPEWELLDEPIHGVTFK